MTETAPERIWATGNGDTGSWNASPATFRGPIETQFVRADLLDEAVKALEAIEQEMRDTGNCIAEVPQERAPSRNGICGDFDDYADRIRATLAKLRSKP